MTTLVPTTTPITTPAATGHVGYDHGFEHPSSAVPVPAQVTAVSAALAALADGLVTYTTADDDSCCEDHDAPSLGDRHFPVDLDTTTSVTASGWTSALTGAHAGGSETVLAWLAGRILAGSAWIPAVLAAQRQGGPGLETVATWLDERGTPDPDAFVDAVAAQIVLDGWARLEHVPPAADAHGIATGTSADPDDHVTLFVEDLGDGTTTRTALTTLTLTEARALADAAITNGVLAATSTVAA